MRRASFHFLAASLLAATISIPAGADTVVVTRAVSLAPDEHYYLDCPPGYIPASFEVAVTSGPTPDLSKDFYEYDEGAPGAFGEVDFNNASSLPTLPGRRMGVHIHQSARTIPLWQGVLLLTCVRTLPTFVFVTTQAAIPANGTGSAIGFCPPNRVPVGQISNADGLTLATRFTVFVSGQPPGVTLMDDLADGTHPPPTGIGRSVSNLTSAPQALRTITYCDSEPGAQLLIYSAPTLPGRSFDFAAPVPDDSAFIGATFVGGTSGAITAVDYWSRNGLVALQLPFLTADPYSGVDLSVKGMFLAGHDTRSPPLAKASARAVLGMLVVPAASAPPPPTIVTIVEFYHAALDHYFITANAQEIGDLDTGVHQGWTRTGFSFKAYGPGSAGRTGRQPVCRAYGNPAAGLDSHFYSASPGECFTTLASFNGAWLLEASEVFEMDLPDATAGACPAGGAPIYRLWNGRADSNHRYVTTLALQAQMTARGYIREGYGPNAVTLCGLQ